MVQSGGWGFQNDVNMNYIVRPKQLRYFNVIETKFYKHECPFSHKSLKI